MIQYDFDFIKSNEYSNKILKKELYDNKNIAKYSNCPHCHGKNFIKFGKYNGIQRYRCKTCKKTFSNTTNSIWKYSKKSAEKWFRFSELLIEEKTLNYCSKSLGISIVTAFYWRHKLLHAIEKIYTCEIFKDIVFINVEAEGLSNKGSKGCAYNYKNKFCKRYDLFRTRVYILNLYDINDSINIKVIGTSNNWWKDSDNKIFCKIDEKAYVKTIDGRTFRDDVINHNKRVPLKIRKSLQYDSHSYYLKDNIICSSDILNSNLKLAKWLSKFKGVASRYLNHYCSLFSILFVKKQYDYMNIFFDILSKSTFQDNYYLKTSDLRSIHQI